MELGDLRAFCLLADTLNFTRTAEALFVSQPTLSRQIGRLERELGTPLFDRTPREVTLTPCGRVFYEDAQKQLAAWETAVQHVAQARDGLRGSLQIGFLRDSPNTAFPAIVRQARQQLPEVALHFRECGMAALVEALRQEQVDAAFSFSEGLAELDEIESLVLGVHPMCAVVPAEHPLAAAQTVRMEQLREEPFVMISPEVSMTGYQSVLARCRKHGFQPAVAACADMVPGLFMLVEAGLGVANLPDSAARIAPPGIRFLPIADCDEPQTTVLAWRRENESPALRAFVVVARQYAAGRAEA